MWNHTVIRSDLLAGFGNRFFVFCFSFLLSFLFSFSGERVVPVHSAENFPVYPCIKANVQFWEQVYGYYTTSHGILHDREYLGRVYTVVELLKRDFPGAKAINEMRVKAARGKVEDILNRLAKGHAPRGLEEKRIASLFGQRASAQSYLDAIERIRLQVGQKDRFTEGVLRSGKYIEQYKQIFASHGLPAELAYLPHVESSFMVKAYSKAGAAGFWQFTRGTGKEYMVVNDLVDERYDPYMAAHSAARLLKTNYEALKSWPLALTAYNCGRGGMLRAVQKKGSYANIFRSYSGGSFGFASRNFYSEFLAAKNVATRLMADPQLQRRMEKPESTVALRLKQDMSISLLRKTYKISQQDFVRLNPALLPPVISGKKAIPKNTLVRLPAANKRARQSSVAELGKPAAQPLSSRSVSSQPITARNTPILQDMAPQARVASKTSRPVADRVINKYHYTVKRGDTLLAIARQFNVSSGELLAANARVDSNMIRPGQRLLIPGQNQKTAPRKKMPQIKQQFQ